MTGLKPGDLKPGGPKPKKLTIKLFLKLVKRPLIGVESDILKGALYCFIAELTLPSRDSILHPAKLG